MGFFGALARGAFGTAKGIGSVALTGGAVSRGLLGAAVGGIAGAQNDFQSPTMQINSILKGAAWGGLIGGGIGAGRTARRGLKAFRTGQRNREMYKYMVQGAPPPAAGRVDRTAWMSGANKWSVRWNNSAVGRGVNSYARAAADVGRGVAANPGLTLLGGAALAGGAMMGGSSSRMMSGDVDMQRINWDQRAAAMDAMQQGSMAPMGQMSTTPMEAPSRRALKESTTGLVQGLHRGRHR